MTELPDLARIEGFDWDRGNADKNWRRHRVAFYECEEVFFREPVMAPDVEHSTAEARYFAFGRTVRGRRLTVVFTVRGQRIRVISARDMNRKERKRHAKI
ncbi:MAG: hypothetical protein A3C53_03635 [Omnitrophica WOR_2 bacterium RIFCSPHIGHO2_02_FULL_68_15]|nr:MAG: hypothetical protein A3C53_03635 [Omnitrophica WOR_2 bacterium RIFCSPHIGHO2_02_FULL_68_15]